MSNLDESLGRGIKAEQEGRPAEAHRHYSAVLAQEPLNRKAVIGLTRVLSTGGNLGDMPRRLVDLIARAPWDFEAIEVLGECDPGSLARNTEAIRYRRRAEPAPRISSEGVQWSSLAHSHDRRMFGEISRAPSVAQMAAQQQAFWMDAGAKRDGLLKMTRIGPQQLPKLWELHVEAARRLGMPPPDLYVDNDVRMNAFAVGIVDCHICLGAGLLDLLTDDEIIYVLGHEMGHIIHRHVLHYSVADQVAGGCFESALRAANTADSFRAWGGTIGAIGSLVANVSADARASEGYRIIERVLRWQQYSEFSADRIGIIACRSVGAAVDAIAKISGLAPAVSASSRFGNTFNLEAFLQQFDEAARHFAHVTPEEDYLSSHPYTAHRIRAMQAWELSWGYHLYVGFRTA